jgi:hypothetical protein
MLNQIDKLSYLLVLLNHGYPLASPQTTGTI